MSSNVVRHIAPGSGVPCAAASAMTGAARRASAPSEVVCTAARGSLDYRLDRSQNSDGKPLLCAVLTGAAAASRCASLWARALLDAHTRA